MATATKSRYMTRKLSELKTTFFVRTELNNDRVLVLMELMDAGEQLDPIIISEDDEIIDGRHRFEAARHMNYEEIACRVHHYDDDIGKIAAAVTANSGKALPPDMGDLRHAVVMMIEAGAGIKKIRDLLPYPMPLLKRLTSDAHTWIKGKKLSHATHLVLDKNYTIQEAADEVHIAAEDIKKELAKQKKKKPDAVSIDSVKTKITEKVNAVVRQNKSAAVKAFEGFEDGTFGAEYVRAVLNAELAAATRIGRQVEDLFKRFEELRNKASRALATSVNEDEDA